MAIQNDFDEHDGDDKYHESSDEDFDPSAAVASDESSSSEDEAVAAPTSKGKRKRKAADTEPEFDSGDEKMIEAARKKKAKKRKGGKDEDDDILLSDDGGGEGGLIKTRAQRRVEGEERKPLASVKGATIDVDSIWAQMMAAPLRPQPTAPTAPAQDSSQITDATKGATAAVTEADETDLVSVRKIYTFAGQQTTEEKNVPRTSLDQYLSEGWKTLDTPAESKSKPAFADTDSETQGSRVRRPLRRPSRFDPNPTGYVRALPPEYQLSWTRKNATATASEQENAPGGDLAKATRPEKAQKLNVVDKSRLDWTGFVHKEGIAEELDVHGKTKEAYLGRMQFLAGVEAKREEERLRMRQKAAATKPAAPL